jgi:hypothetical protein
VLARDQQFASHYRRRTPVAITRCPTRAAAASGARYYFLIVLKREHAFWIIVVLIAAATRVLGLGAPLADGEARVALAALSVARGDPAVLLNPLHGVLQSVLFAVFGDGAWVSRLLAASFGTLLCALPLLARERLGRERAMMFALLLALSPTLMFASRQAAGGMLAWTLAAIVVLLPATRPVWRATAFGLLLACGVDAPFAALTAICLCYLDGAALLRFGVDAQAARRMVLLGGIAFAIGVSGLLLRPAGFSDVFAGYAAWAAGWGTASGFSSGRLLSGFLVNELTALVFALIGALWMAVHAQARAGLALALGWLAAGLLIIALYAGRDVLAVVPLTIGAAWLASAALGRIFAALAARVGWMEWAAAGVAFVALQFVGVGLRQYAQQGQDSFLLPIPVAVMMCTALVLASYLNGDLRIGLRGIGTGLAATLLLYTLGVGVQLTQVRWNNPAEPYVLNAPSGALIALADTMRATSIRATGVPNAVPLVMDPTAPPSLRWALREQRDMRSGSEFGELNAAVFPQALKPQSARGFIGSPFEVLRSSELNIVCTRGADNRLDCTQLARWFAFRTLDPSVTVDSQRWTLWLSDSLAARSGGQ